MATLNNSLDIYLAVLILFAFVCSNGNNAHVNDSKKSLSQAPGVKVQNYGILPTTADMIANRLPARNVNASNRYKLPTWFNYEQFKQLFGKRYLKPEEDEIHKRIYLRTAMKVLEQRALFRVNRTNTLPSINELSDMTTAELLALRRIPQEASHKVADQLTCCTYDQVHDKIIKLLDDARAKEETVPGLSSAYVDELQQEPILVTNDDDSAETGVLREDTDYKQDRGIATVKSITGASQPVPSPSSRENAQKSNPHPTRASFSSILYSSDRSVSQHIKTTLRPQTTRFKVGMTGSRPEDDGLISDDNSTTTDESSDFDPAIAEKVRQQIESQLRNSTQGRQLTEQLSSYFGQPIKLTASIAIPTKSSSAATKIKSQLAHS